MTCKYFDREAVELIAAAMLRQACMDYWNLCEPKAPPEIPPLIYDRETGKRRRMTPAEYAAFLYQREQARQRELAALERYFRSPLFHLITEADGEQIMERLAYLRRRGRRPAALCDDFPQDG